MPTHGQVAAKVRAHKESNPELYCPIRNCLWRIVDRKGNYVPCGKHGGKA